MRVEKKTKLLPIKLKSVYTIVCIHLSCKLDKFKHISLAVLQSVQGGVVPPPYLETWPTTIHVVWKRSLLLA